MRLLSHSFLTPGLLSLSIAAILHAGAATAASTAGQLVQPSYAPVQQHVGGGIMLPATAGLTAPAGAKKLFVTPAGLQVEGGFPTLANATARIETRIKGRRVSAAYLFAAAQELETAYINAGYLLARVSLPPQQIKDGAPLRVVITDGYVERIDASALPESARHRVESLLQPLVGEKQVTRKTLERRLLLAGDTPGVMLKSTLKPGEKPGSTVLIVDGRYDAVTGLATFDNGLSDELGKYSLGVGGQLNNLTGFGEQIYARLNGYPRGDNPFTDTHPHNRQWALGAVVPLGNDGAWMNVEGVDSRTLPKSDNGLTSRDHFQRLSTRLGYHWVRARDFNTSTLLSFDVQNETQHLQFNHNELPFTDDRLRIVRLAQSMDYTTDFDARFVSSLTASFGIDGLGARHGSADLLMSRNGADPDFQKLELTMNYSQPLVDGKVQLSLSGLAQTSFDQVLPSSEQASLGGSSWLSAFDSGTVSGDSALAARAEVGLPQPLGEFSWAPGVGSAVMPYLFGSLGSVSQAQPTALEKKEVHGSAYGAGLRLSASQVASPNSAMLTVEYARGNQSGASQDDRVNLNLVTFF